MLVLARARRFVNLDAELRQHAPGGEYAARRARRKRSVEDARVSRQQGELFGAFADEPNHLDEARNVARAVLDARDVLVRTETRDRLGCERDARVLRDVVEDDGRV